MPTFRTPLEPLKKTPVGEQLTSLGEFINTQRKQAELSLRQLAEQSGVSNPYLSQIERGLRKPSAEVLQGLARALRISAETLYVRAGILDPDEQTAPVTVEAAIQADTRISKRQKQVLTDVYTSFLLQNAEQEEATPPPPAARKKPAARKTTPRKTTPGRAESPPTKENHHAHDRRQP